MVNSPDTFPDKHPLTDRAVSISWAKDLGVGEEIDTSTWDYEGDDNALILSLPSHTTDLASVFVDGGTLGAQYRLINTIATTSNPVKHLTSEKYLNIREVTG